jgi:Ca-activated chloride channel family protein
MHFAFPWAFVALPVLALMAWRHRSRGRRGAAVRYSDLRLVPPHARTPREWAGTLTPWLRVIAAALLVVALARPQGHGKPEKLQSAGVDIMLTMDISGSMLAEDFEPQNRFAVAQATLERFARETSDDRLGLVIFAARAFTQCPLTLDHQMVAELIAQVKQGMIQDGTAVGMAIATAAHRLEASPAKSRVIILMTDGVSNTGKIDPVTAARAATALGIRIYAVGVGKPGGAPIAMGDGLFGKQYLRNPDGTLQLTEVDEKTLKQVAQIGGGKYYRVTDAQAMDRVYAEIRSLEKTRFESGLRRSVTEEFGRFVWPALVLLALALLLDCTWARRVP